MADTEKENGGFLDDVLGCCAARPSGKSKGEGGAKDSLLKATDLKSTFKQTSDTVKAWKRARVRSNAVSELAGC